MTMQTTNGSDLEKLPAPALAKRAPDDAFRFGLEPDSLTQALAVCDRIAKMGLANINTSEQALLRLMTGRALGIPAMVALQHVYDVNGRTSLSAKLKVALCLRHPDCEYFVHVSSDENKATYKCKRRGEDEQTRTFTIEDAKRAQLSFKPDSNWSRYPRRMLQARASSELADIVFPDATMGLLSTEEAEETERPGELRGEVVPPTVPARNWTQESDAIKAALTDAVQKADKARMTETRKKMKTFLDEAPASIGEDLQRYYNMVKDQATKPAEAPKTGTAPTQSGYLPPEQRGDSYDGPESPPFA